MGGSSNEMEALVVLVRLYSLDEYGIQMSLFFNKPA